MTKSSDLGSQACMNSKKPLIFKQKFCAKKTIAVGLIAFGLIASFVYEVESSQPSVSKIVEQVVVPKAGLEKCDAPSSTRYSYSYKNSPPEMLKIAENHFNISRTFWTGGAVAPADKILRSANEVLDLFERSDSIGYKKLLLETIAIESHFGRAISYKGAHGLTQVIVSTARETFKLAEKESTQKYKTALMKTYDKSLSFTDNLKYNTTFNMAIFVAYCDLYGKAPQYEKQLQSREGRWKFYGRYWGAVGRGGASTRKQYYLRAEEIKSWIANDGKNTWGYPKIVPGLEKKMAQMAHPGVAQMQTVASRNVATDGVVDKKEKPKSETVKTKATPEPKAKVEVESKKMSKPVPVQVKKPDKKIEKSKKTEKEETKQKRDKQPVKDKKKTDKKK